MAEPEKSRDRLSELPNSLILHILSLMPMQHVVRTTLLSKRWHDVWRTLSSLTFDDKTNDAEKFRIFLNRTLMLWRGTNILKFHVTFDNSHHYFSADVDLWLRVAMNNQAEDLSLNLANGPSYPENDDDEDDDPYSAPLRLFSCSWIRKLSLVSCNVAFGGDVKWEKLEFLKIEGVRLSDDVLGRMLSGSPNLQVLILRVVESHECLSISSECLRELTIEKYSGREVAKHTMVTIWAPNLESLEVSGVVYSRFLLLNVESLINVDVGFRGWVDSFSESELLGEMMVHVFEGVCRARSVTLSTWSAKMLVLMKKKGMVPLSSRSNAKYLKVCGGEGHQIMELLEMFPNLITLVIESSDFQTEPNYPSLNKFWKPRYPPKKNDRSNRYDFITQKQQDDLMSSRLKKSLMSFPKGALVHLRTVEITWVVTNNSIYPLIELVLKYGSTLEKMVLRLQQIMSLAPRSMFLLTQRLLGMRRLSPSLKVSLIEC